KSGSFALLGGKQLGAVDKQLERTASAVEYVSPTSPPLFVLHGTADELVLADQAERIVAAYAAAGLPARLMMLDGAGHGAREFFSGPAMQAVIDFLKQHSTSHAAKRLDR